jgi:predicted RNA binding protein YcfA (HicA-like mRNA interferase family)
MPDKITKNYPVRVLLARLQFFFEKNFQKNCAVDSDYTIFAQSNNNIIIIMKRLKVTEIIKLLKEDGWYLHTIKGDHRQFKHPVKKGKVTVNGKPGDTLSQELLNSIFKQAGWR